MRGGKEPELCEHKIQFARLIHRKLLASLSFAPFFFTTYKLMEDKHEFKGLTLKAKKPETFESLVATRKVALKM